MEAPSPLFLLIFITLTATGYSQDNSNPSSATPKKSCRSHCEKNAFPHCGAWLYGHNAAAASGIYPLNASFVNLTCAVHSLPRPVPIKWIYQAEHEPPTEAVCTSLRTVTECKINEIGEHRVQSSCLIRMATLQHSGRYFCQAESQGDLKAPDITSEPAQVEVHGIASIEAVPKTHLLYFNDTNIVQVEICSNPKPHVTWINENTGQIIPAGRQVGNYSARHLYKRLRTDEPSKPSRLDPYCYVSELLISKTTRLDTKFAVIADNHGYRKTVIFNTRLTGLPVGKNSPPQRSFVHLLTLLLCATGLVYAYSYALLA